MCLNRLGSGLCEAVHNRRCWTSPRWGRRIDSSSHGLKKWAELELPISEGLGFRTRCSRAPRSSGIRLDKEKRSRVGLYNSNEKKEGNGCGAVMRHSDETVGSGGAANRTFPCALRSWGGVDETRLRAG